MITFDERLIVDVQVPEEWFHDTPRSWRGTTALARLEKAWPEIDERIRWDRPTKSGDASAGSPESRPAGAITSADQLIDRLEASLPAGHVPSCAGLKRHAGLYVLLAYTALTHLPTNPGPAWAGSTANGLSVIMETPGVFQGATRGHYRWELNTCDGYTYRVRNLGGRRIRIEIVYGRLESPFGGFYRGGPWQSG